MNIPRLTCSIDSIDITGILRKDQGDISDLVRSIQENLDKGLPALIHPVVVDNGMKLISGSRRLAAHRKLGLKEIDYAFYSVLDESERVRLEVAANYQKVFNWVENCLAIEKYHKFYQTQAHLKGTQWGMIETGKLLGISRSNSGRAVLMAEYIHANDKDILECETMKDAFSVLIKREEEAHARLLVVQSLPSAKPGTAPVKKPTSVADDDFFVVGPQGGFAPAVGGPTGDERPGAKINGTGPVIPLSSMLLKSSGPSDLSILEGLGAGCCDHIVTDPPYGVPDHIKTIFQGTRFADAADVEEEHVAKETEEMMAQFYSLAFRAIRDKGFVIMFCDPVFWWQHCINFTAAGFGVQRWPIVWLKTSACINQMANMNWTKNIEFAVVARKTGATLMLPQKGCMWSGGNDMETRLIGHTFAKPFGLWEWIYKAICMRGAEVLDPFVGKGSSVFPALDLGLRPRGIECSQIHFDGLVANVMSKYKAMDPSCTFV